MKLTHNITAGVMTMSQENYITKLLEMEELLSKMLRKLIVSLISASISRFTRLFARIAARLRIAYTTTA